MYEKLDTETEAKNTDYILQTLWRDLTSMCDIVGPYYTNSGTFKAKNAQVIKWIRHAEKDDGTNDVNKDDDGNNGVNNDDNNVNGRFSKISMSWIQSMRSYL